MGTMNFSNYVQWNLTYRILAVFFFAYEFLSIIAYKRSLESKHENAFCSASCTTSSHVLDLNRMSQGYYFADGCYGR